MLGALTPSLISSLAGIATKSPMARIALKYWWLSIPAGIALYGRIKKRRDKGEKIDCMSTLDDVGAVLTPVMPIIILGEMLAQQETAAGMGHLKQAQQIPPQSAPVPSPAHARVEFAQPA